MSKHRIILLLVGAVVSTVATTGDWLSPNLAIPLVPVRALGVEGVIFPQERASEAWVGEDVVQFWTPTAKQVEQLERKLKPFLESVRANPLIGRRWPTASKSAAEYRSRELGKIIEHFSEYRRQYVGIFVGSSKRIFVNSFPGPNPDGTDSHSYWTQQFVVVQDGGFRYWTAEYDVSRGEFVLLESNGYA